MGETFASVVSGQCVRSSDLRGRGLSAAVACTISPACAFLCDCSGNVPFRGGFHSPRVIHHCVLRKYAELRLIVFLRMIDFVFCFVFLLLLFTSCHFLSIFRFHAKVRFMGTAQTSSHPLQCAVCCVVLPFMLRCSRQVFSSTSTKQCFFFLTCTVHSVLYPRPESTQLQLISACFAFAFLPNQLIPLFGRPRAVPQSRAATVCADPIVMYRYSSGLLSIDFCISFFVCLFCFNVSITVTFQVTIQGVQQTCSKTRSNASSSR